MSRETFQSLLDEIDDLIDSSLHPGELDYLMKKKEDILNKLQSLDDEQ